MYLLQFIHLMNLIKHNKYSVKDKNGRYRKDTIVDAGVVIWISILSSTFKPPLL